VTLIGPSLVLGPLSAPLAGFAAVAFVHRVECDDVYLRPDALTVEEAGQIATAIAPRCWAAREGDESF